MALLRGTCHLRDVHVVACISTVSKCHVCEWVECSGSTVLAARVLSLHSQYGVVEEESGTRLDQARHCDCPAVSHRTSLKSCIQETHCCKLHHRHIYKYQELNAWMCGTYCMIRRQQMDKTIDRVDTRRMDKTAGKT